MARGRAANVKRQVRKKNRTDKSQNTGPEQATPVAMLHDPTTQGSERRDRRIDSLMIHDDASMHLKDEKGCDKPRRSKHPWKMKVQRCLCRMWPCRLFWWICRTLAACCRAFLKISWTDKVLITVLFLSVYIGCWLALDGLLKIFRGVSAQENCSIVYVPIPGPIITVSLVGATPSDPARGTYYYSVVNGTTEWLDSIAPPATISLFLSSTMQVPFTPPGLVRTSGPPTPPQATISPTNSELHPSIVTNSVQLPLSPPRLSKWSGTTFSLDTTTLTVPPVPTSFGKLSTSSATEWPLPSQILWTSVMTGLSGLLTTVTLTTAPTSLPLSTTYTKALTTLPTSILPHLSSLVFSGTFKPPTIISSNVRSDEASLTIPLPKLSSSWPTLMTGSPPVLPPTVPYQSLTMSMISPPSSSTIRSVPGLLSPTSSRLPTSPIATSTRVTFQTSILPVLSSYPPGSRSNGVQSSLPPMSTLLPISPSSIISSPRSISITPSTFLITTIPSSLASISFSTNTRSDLTASYSLNGGFSSSRQRIFTGSTASQEDVSLSLAWDGSQSIPICIGPVLGSRCQSLETEMITKVISYGNVEFNFAFPTPDVTTTVSYWTGVYPTVTGTEPSPLATTTRTVRQSPLSELPPFELFNTSGAGLTRFVTTVVSGSTVRTRTEVAAAEITSCGEYGNFTLTFDDSVAGPDNNKALLVHGMTNPYHHLFYANGYTYVPDKWEPYPAISQPNVAMFLPIGASLLPNTPFAGTLLPGEIGAGPRASVNAYWFNAYSGFFGCALNGITPCTLRISGYRYDTTLQQEVVAVEQNVTIPACWGYIGCQLVRVNFTDGFQALSGIQFNAYTYNLGIAQMFMMDNLNMEWYNNTCAAGILRIGHHMGLP